MLTVLGLGPGSEIEKSLNLYSDQKVRLAKRLGSFIEWKKQHPLNGSGTARQGFGNSDKQFSSDGNFGTKLPNISHAHLTHDHSVVYRIDQSTETLYLYGIYTHDRIGTGNPPSASIQQSMASRWANADLSDTDGQDPAASLDISDKKDSDKKEKDTNKKPDYTPKPKPVPSAPKTDELSSFVNQVDILWPQRNFAGQMSTAQTKNEKLAVINKEVGYLTTLRQRSKLYTNQLNYLKALGALFNYIKSST